MIHTTASPAQLDAIKARMKRGTVFKKRATPKASLVEQRCLYIEDERSWELQLPFIAYSPNEKVHWSVIDSHREPFRLALRTLLRGVDRSEIEHVTFTRISPKELDEDNLPPSLKPFLDDVCSWILHGDAEFNKHTNGHSDGQLAREGLTWERQQEQSNTKGIRIRFRMRGTSAESSRQ